MTQKLDPNDSPPPTESPSTDSAEISPQPTDQPTPAPVAAKNSSKKLILILSSIVGVLLLIGGGAFALYRTGYLVPAGSESEPTDLLEEAPLEMEQVIEESTPVELEYIQDDPGEYGLAGATRFFLAEYEGKLMLHKTSRSLHPRLNLMSAAGDELHVLYEGSQVGNYDSKIYGTGYPVDSPATNAGAYPPGVRLIALLNQTSYGVPAEMRNVFVSEDMISFGSSPDRSMVFGSAFSMHYETNVEDSSIQYSEDNRQEPSAWFAWREGSTYATAPFDIVAIAGQTYYPILHSFSTNNKDLAIVLAECWNCGGAPWKYLVMRVEDGKVVNSKNIGSVQEFRWLADGRYQYKDVVIIDCPPDIDHYGPCTQDVETLPFKSGTLD